MIFKLLPEKQYNYIYLMLFALLQADDFLELIDL